MAWLRPDAGGVLRLPRQALTQISGASATIANRTGNDRVGAAGLRLAALNRGGFKGPFEGPFVNCLACRTKTTVLFRASRIARRERVSMKRLPTVYHLVLPLALAMLAPGNVRVAHGQGQEMPPIKVDLPPPPNFNIHGAVTDGAPRKAR